MCDCCKKIIVQTNTTTTGNTIDFISVENIIVEAPYEFNYTALADGDYILQLELTGNDTSGVAIDLSSTLIKNSVPEVNINDVHRLGLGEKNADITYTHNCKITGIVTGDTMGFLLDTTLITNIKNGSITVIKIA
jgi:hypothetical protein